MSEEDRARGPRPRHRPSARRERRRRETLEEMTRIARDLIRNGHEVTFRALAARMELTPSALYRYVDSVADLNGLVADAIFAGVVDEMAEAYSVYDQDDPAAQIVAAATAFRCWALDNVAEFRLVFTTTALSVRPAGFSPPAEIRSDEPSGVELFTRLFGVIFVRLAHQRKFRIPVADELDDEYVAAHSTSLDPAGRVASDGPGQQWLFELGWVQLLGVVAVEAFGHVRPPLVSSGAFFMAQMQEIGRRSGMDEDWDRLMEVSKAVLDRRSGPVGAEPARVE